MMHKGFTPILYIPVFALFGAVCLVAEKNIYGLMCLVFYIWAGCGLMLMTGEHRYHLHLYREFENMLGTLRHYYHMTGLISESVYYAAECTEGMLEEYLRELYRVVCDGNAADIEVLKTSYPDKYLRQFTAITIKTAEEGDVIRGEGCGFIGQLTMLQEDISFERRFLQKRRHLFAGYLPTAIMPLVFVPFIKKWGISVGDGMMSFYLGIIGQVVMWSILLLSVMSFFFIAFIREGKVDSLLFFVRGDMGDRIKEKIDTVAGKLFAETRMHEETVRFQSLIAIELAGTGATILSLLELMESFAGIFQKNISKCIASYVTRDKDAVTIMKEETAYIPFRHLAECLEAADDIGTGAAFEELTSDIKRVRKDNEQQLLLLLEDRAVLGMLLAVLPGMVILFGYLLIPFMMNALTMFESYANKAAELLEE